MTLAMEQAAQAAADGDAPFGCVVIDGNGQVVWKDRDRVKSLFDPTAHAEINAVRGLCRKLRVTKLDGYSFVTTSEPCPTCLSTLIRVRAARCVFGAKIEKNASLPISSIELAERSTKHRIELMGDTMAEACTRQREDCANACGALAEASVPSSLEYS